jgi:hypothetical protein
VIRMTRQCQCFHLKVTVGFDVIHERSSASALCSRQRALDTSVSISSGAITSSASRTAFWKAAA